MDDEAGPGAEVPEGGRSVPCSGGERTLGEFREMVSSRVGSGADKETLGNSGCSRQRCSGYCDCSRERDSVLGNVFSDSN